MSLAFKDEMAAIVARGYNKGYAGPGGPLRSLVKSLPHALGEAIYKIVRYHSKGDPQDLVKAAAWLEMEYDANHTGSRIGDNQEPGPARPPLEGPRDRREDLNAGNVGGCPGRGGDGETDALRRFASQVPFELEVRAGSGSRRRKPVDSKHRPRKGKGRT